MAHEPTVPLSARQRYEWRWLAEQPNVPSHQIATTYEVRGTLDVKRLAEALRVVLAHHDQLRLRVTGPAHAPVATCRSVPDTVPLPVIGLDGLDESTCDRLVDVYQEREAATLLNLGDAREASGDVEAAITAWARAAAVLDELQHPRAIEAHARLERFATVPPASTGVVTRGEEGAAGR